ncbi:SCO2102 family sporulation regulator [Streptomyces sp. NPDC002514]|uniref:SCO2102 family sporulation regulator n=1 Tax=unclassified Streptomyces TaxID=2593676 RepID=UPI00369BED78
MGWAVLYLAFGIVALWLLGEVLLQYKARLRWRLLAFVGFLGVVLGVLMPSVVVIALGAVAFAVGQTYVTLSFRRGFAEGWVVRRGAVGGKRRGGGPDHQDDRDPDPGAQDPSAARTGQGADAGDAGYRQDGEYGQDGGYGHDGAPHGGHDGDYDRDDVFAAAHPGRQAAEATAVYEPQPMPEDTGSYGIYGDSAHAAAAQHQDPGYAATAQGADQGYSYDYSGYGQQQYGYDTGDQQQYAPYSDPYVGAQNYGGAAYDNGYGGQQYGQQPYGQDQYGNGGYGETPAGGVWVPQQRTDETYGGELPQEQPYPYQGDGQQQGHGQQQGNGYDEHYRF